MEVDYCTLRGYQILRYMKELGYFSIMSETIRHLIRSNMTGFVNKQGGDFTLASHLKMQYDKKF